MERFGDFVVATLATAILVLGALYMTPSPL
jgi:hypothetical protein